jgi:hypothetical protein
MSRALALVALTLVALARAAEGADPRVPAIPAADLPVAGTVAPIPDRDVTFITNGPREDFRYFAVSGVAQAVQYQQLEPLLRRRAGPERPSRHAVWITASARHAWAHAVGIVQACVAAGIHRVGLRVRSETNGQVLGFPLFVPAAAGQPRGTRAGRLEVRVQMVPASESSAPSDVGHVYAAAMRAMEKRREFGVEKIVADVSLPMDVPLQYAVSVLDLLYRGGVSGVRLRGGVRIPRGVVRQTPKIEIQGGRVRSVLQSVEPPRVQPRARPWPLEGAAEPGWVDFTLVELPSLGAPKKPGAVEERPVNYAAAGVPPDVMKAADLAVRRWARELGADLLEGLRGGEGIQRRLAVGLRQQDAIRRLVEPARKAFPDATSVIPATLQVNALLFDKGNARGRADVTVFLAGRELAVIFGNWRDVGGAQGFTLPPLLVDPFARGVPGSFRVWFEGVLGDARRRGAAALPMAAGDEVLRYFPRVAQAGVGSTLARRQAPLAAMAAQVARGGYDRVVLSVQRGTATVVAGRVVVGVLDFSLRAEENELRLDDLRARRAP